MSDELTCSICNAVLPERKGMKTIRCQTCNAIHLLFGDGRVRKAFSGFESALLVLKEHPTVRGEHYAEEFK